MTATLSINPTAQISRPSPTLQRSRFAVASLFFINGMVLGQWVARIPAIQSALGLSNGVFGLALLAMALGALVAMPMAGWCSERFGSRQVSQVVALVYAGLLPGLSFAPNIWVFVIALFGFGAGHGALDIGMNAQAVMVQKRYGRSIMSSFHALFSLGGLAGAATGGMIAAHGIAPIPHFAVASMAMVLLAVATFPFLLDERSDLFARPRNHTPMFAWPTAGLFALGMLAFCSMMGEGAMADWSALYLRRVLHSTEGTAAAGYAAFSVTMAATRFFGDGISARLGPVQLVQLGGGTALIGLVLVLLSSYPLLALLGFACIGAGFSTVVPMAFSAAGHTPGVSPGIALASVTTVGYLGFLLGPPAIGFAAEFIGLRNALALLLVTTGLVIALAPRVEPERTRGGIR